MKELLLLDEFAKHGITMWNPNTNYLAYLDHFKEILDYCIEKKTYSLKYDKWLDLLKTEAKNSKIGSETHNICHGLCIIDSTYTYNSMNISQSDFVINIPKDLIYQYYTDNNSFSNEFWKIVSNRLLNFYKKNNVFKLINLDHIQMISLNLFACYLLYTNKTDKSELAEHISFAKKQSSDDLINKISKVYDYDVCKKDANILEKLGFVSNGESTKLGDKFCELLMAGMKGNDIMNRLFEEKEKGGINKIYYGAPGCGKSFKVQKDLDDVGVIKENRIRTVFHPEYANCDFAGQIMPKVNTDKSVTYEFNPGPFTLAIKQALKTNKMVYLIIEEINRGNAAAIFGDLFQLLDRKRENDQMGRSEYDIENPNIEKYLIDSLRKEEGIDLGNDYHLFIPSNLTILATMNSSDQNVFTLDTAFKRRWYFEQIDNDIINDTNHTYKDWYVPGTETTWKDFMIAVNKKILRNKIQNQTNEDKRMGKYFVTKDCLVENIGDQNEDAARNFAYKVLEYLWNDVCKIGKEDWFDIELYETLEDLVTGFIGNETGDPLSIFKDYINLFGLDENQ